MCDESASESLRLGMWNGRRDAASAVNGSMKVLWDPDRLSRFFVAVTALTSAQTLDELLKGTARSARSLVQAGAATLTVTDRVPGLEGRVFFAGHRGGAEGAPFEREIRVSGRPFATLRVTSRRTHFASEDEELLDLLCTHAGIAIENALLRDRKHVVQQVRNLLEEISGEADGNVRDAGDLRIDLACQEVFADGARVHVTRSEFRLLELLTEEPGRAYTRDEILSRLWDTGYLESPRAADAHVARLRRKIERDPLHPERLLTVRGVGYKLAVADLHGAPARP